MNRKRKTLKIFITIVSFIMFYILFTTTSKAALSISTSKTTVSPGETFNVTVSVGSDEAGAITLSASNGTLSTTSIDLMTQSSVTVTCTAGNSGSINLSASGKVANYTSETEDTKTASRTVTIQTNTNTSGSSTSSTSTTKSSEARLSNLGINPNDFSGFKADKYEYSVEVPNDVSSVKVYATAKNSKATVSGTGTKKLEVGKNTAKVVVKAEDGTTKTYTITITRKDSGDSDDEKPTNEVIENTVVEETTEEPTEDNVILGLEKLEIKEYNITPKFELDVYDYSVEVGEDISSLNIEAISNIEGATVEIVGNENFVNGENIVTILITNPETEETATYQITVNKRLALAEQPFDEIRANITKMWIIRGAIVLAAGIITAILVIRYKKQSNIEETAIPYSGIAYNSDWNGDAKEKKAEKKSLEDNKSNTTDSTTTKRTKTKKSDEIEDEIFDDDDDAIKKYGKRKGKHF